MASLYTIDVTARGPAAVGKAIQRLQALPGVQYVQVSPARRIVTPPRLKPLPGAL